MSESTLPTDLGRYRLTLGRRRGLQMKPMVFCPKPDPIPGESLLGLVARAVDRNGFRSLNVVLRLADIAGSTAGILPRVDQDAVERLAYVLKVPSAEIISRTHRAVEPEDGASGTFIDFYGVPLRALYREKARRRVSPRALAIAPYHRAIHDIRPLLFCPETMEYLIDRCPVCDRLLGWHSTCGVAMCEHCLDDNGRPFVDLRDFPQPMVEVTSHTGLCLIAGLVNP